MTTTTNHTLIEASSKVPTIAITREFDAPRHLVWRAHTDPDLYARWIGPRSVGTTIRTWDVRRGGEWAFANTRDGAEVAAFFGSFHDVWPGERIVWTFTYEGVPEGVALETLTFEELPGDRTRLRILSVVESFEFRDSMLASGMETGVNEGYEKLDELLASLS